MPRVIDYEPIAGLPDPAFRVRLRGQTDVETLAGIYLEMVAQTTGFTLNTVLDRRGADSVAGLTTYQQFFERLREAGIRRYCAAVVDTDPHRHHMAALAEEVARTAGLEARIRHVWTEDAALDFLKEMMAGP